MAGIYDDARLDTGEKTATVGTRGLKQDCLTDFLKGTTEDRKKGISSSSCFYRKKKGVKRTALPQGQALKKEKGRIN